MIYSSKMNETKLMQHCSYMLKTKWFIMNLSPLLHRMKDYNYMCFQFAYEP